ncbi:UNVERIFIED_CONTAM: SURP and G-patch domain-containing protein 1-like protein [Sesamum angustifolium]|uniref:SURP and G-patch domain-containing protein 1-like protein n=1 Tax=Sesamum angustifolium TaxID=2727405 RepID=A0AAW2RI62_9LAMI
MDKVTDPSLFVNDGSFLERFKQLQQETKKKGEVLDKSRSGSSTSITSTPKAVISKTTIEFKANGSKRATQAPSSGKLAFSLKQKSKLVVAPLLEPCFFVFPLLVWLRQPGRNSDFLRVEASSPPFPSDPTVRKVADKLASFVAKNGRQFEHVTRQKNPGDTPFKFLFDESCSDYKYYEYRLNEEEKALSQTRDSQTSQNGTATSSLATSSQRPHHQQSKYQTPASALYETTEVTGSTDASSQIAPGRYGESSAPTGSDPIAMMEYFMKKAAQEEKLRPPKPSKDEMPPPASLQAPKRGHHMGDYIPPEELEKFLSTCNDAAARKAAKEYVDKAKIQADNIGHRLLSKMGWKEGKESRSC